MTRSVVEVGRMMWLQVATDGAWCVDDGVLGGGWLDVGKRGM